MASIGPHLPKQGSRSTLVVSHHFDGLLRVWAPGVLQPEPDGVRRVLQSLLDIQPKQAWEASITGLRLAAHLVPFKGFPSPAASDVSPRADALLPFTAPDSLFDT